MRTVEQIIRSCLAVYHKEMVVPLPRRGVLEIELPAEERQAIIDHDGEHEQAIDITPDGSVRVMGVLVKEKKDG